MKTIAGVLLLGAMLTAAPMGRAAEVLPAPIGSSAVTAQREGSGFGADVENALDDLTRLQCNLLFFLTPRQGCPTK
jgi:hypothetical protein